MKNRVKCRICGKEFKQITYCHLEKSHGITLDEYKKMYPEDDLTPTRTRKGFYDEETDRWVKIKHKDRPKVKCEICGKHYYRITNLHLKEHNTNLEEYRRMYPNAKIFISVEEERKLISEHHADISGEKNPFYGKHHTKETIKQIIESGKKYREEYHKTDEWLNVTCDWCGNKFHKKPSHIKKNNFCCKDCYNKWHSRNMRKDNNPNWRGGISREPYGFEFSRELKQEIKNRDGNKCVICGSDKNLAVHHIDYNKKNNNPDNLITLCGVCHGKTNGNREYWIKFFHNLERGD